MTRRRTRLLGGGLLAALVLATTGCEVGTDDEMAPAPTKTITATPTQSVAPAPAAIPVGKGAVSPDDVVWAQGGVLHVGRKQLDLAPIEIEAFVVVPGGAFLLSRDELWFTDLSKVKGTGQTDVTGVRASADGGRLEVVDTRSGQPLAQGYDTASGKAVRGDVDVLTPQEFRAGPGRYEVRTGGGKVSVVDTKSGTRVPVAGLPAGFEVGGWAGDSLFFGVAGKAGDRSVLACDLVRHRCTEQGAVTGQDPVVFGSGI